MRGKIYFGLIHLCLVLLGASGVEVEEWGKVGTALGLYGSLSGSTSGFSFFAPGVGSPMRASFDVTESDGRVVTDTLGAADREIALRVGNIVEAFRDQLDEQDTRRALAASWAGYVLRRHPEARQVRVRLEEFDLPMMQDYRQNAGRGWQSVYRATFKSQKASAR